MSEPENTAEREFPPICDYEGSTYQTEFWEQGGREYEDRVEAIALRRLLPPKGELLLEVGAGAGRNTPRYQGYDRIVLLDYSITQLQQAQARLGRDERYIYVAADAYRLPFVKGLFDSATMIRVLHHMAHGPKVIRGIREVLRPGGVFILEFANKRNLKAIARYLLRKQTWNPFDPHPIEFVELNFNFHPATTRQWLREAGFAIEQQLTVSHFRIWWLKRVVPISWLVALDAALQWTGNWWQYSPSVFLRSRAQGESVLAAPGTFFRCLQCGNTTFHQTSQQITCQTCGTQWAIHDGIYNFKSPVSTNLSFG